MQIFAATALLPTGWVRDVRLTADAGGELIAVTPDSTAAPGDTRLAVVIPGIPNLHSHAFQRAIAGLTERRSPAGRDSFWTWRETMYALCARFTPEDAEAVAAQLHVELLEHGFTALAEFHYLHHQPDGTPYADPAEMARRNLAAATRSGIGLTLLPSLYRHGGIFGREPSPGQRRFLNDLDPFLRIAGLCRDMVAGNPNAAWGLAPHSLRAVTPQQLGEVAGFATRHGVPLHIHAAEQQQEVADCRTATGARPVEWLLHNVPIGPGWCLIHCTHMTEAEASSLAGSGAIVGLCPSTEASLGDGIFPLPGYRALLGRFGIGTDSHVGIAPRDELRQLETSQRLALQQRAIATDEAQPHPARSLLDSVLAGGAQACHRDIGALAPGMRCDLVELDPEHPTLAARSGDTLLDSWVFSGQANPVRTVIVGGRPVVEAGRHIAAEPIARDFRAALHRLAA